MIELKTAWGDWLGRMQWTHASTLTFREPRTMQAVRRAMQRHLRDLARRAHRKVAWFCACLERHTWL